MFQADALNFKVIGNLWRFPNVIHLKKRIHEDLRTYEYGLIKNNLSNQFCDIESKALDRWLQSLDIICCSIQSQ